MLIIIIAGVSLAGCQKTTTESGKPIIAVSIVPESAFVKAVAGDLVDVITVIPPGYSPGNYEPSARTMEEISNARLYFTIGVPTESGNILPQVKDIEIVNLETLVSQTYPDRTFGDGGRDPHIWLSIKRVVLMTQIIRDKLQEIDPDNANVYADNAAAFITLLNQTDAQIKTIFSDVTMNKFIVFHPSFGYFADEYDLTMIALEENGKEATATHLQEVIDIANQYDIKSVFNQAEIDSTQVESFADEIGGTVVTLYPLSDDYCNNLINMANAIREALR